MSLRPIIAILALALPAPAFAQQQPTPEMAQHAECVGRTAQALEPSAATATEIAAATAYVCRGERAADIDALQKRAPGLKYDDVEMSIDRMASAMAQATVLEIRACKNDRACPWPNGGRPSAPNPPAGK